MNQIAIQLTGKKIEYHSVFYKNINIAYFSIETAGIFELDTELKIWIGGSETPVISKPFKKDDSIFDIHKILAIMTLHS